LLQSALKHAFNDISRMQREQETFLKRELTKRLMPIRDSAESLAQISHVLSDDVRIRISTLLNGVKDLTGLVGTMQQIQDIESGMVKVDKTTVDLAQLVNKAIAELNMVYGGLVDIQCQNELSNAQIVADAALVTGAMQSLLQHAIEHVAPLAENVVKLHLLNENDRAVVHVRYGGESVPPEQLANFFEKFSADMPNADTTGLETNYAYLVTAAHGGEISVISDDISGTTVTMMLPQ
jgi:K+-sensing histidine kinase KdpD